MTTSAQRTMPMPASIDVGDASTVSTPLSTLNRPRGYLALAVALIVGFAALGFWFYGRAAAKVPVLVAATTIPAGHVITTADVTTEPVAGGITAVSADHLSDVVGHPAAVEILSHTPVQLAMVATGSPLPAADVLVGLAAAPGQIPSSGLIPGDLVEVLRLPAKTSSASSVSSPVLTSATVFDVRPDPAVEGATLLTLEVPRAAAYSVSAAGDAGLVALVQEGGAGQ